MYQQKYIYLHLLHEWIDSQMCWVPTVLRIHYKPFIRAFSVPPEHSLPTFQPLHTAAHAAPCSPTPERLPVFFPWPRRWFSLSQGLPLRSVTTLSHSLKMHTPLFHTHHLIHLPANAQHLLSQYNDYVPKRGEFCVLFTLNSKTGTLHGLW